MRIVSRAGWGATPWRTLTATVPDRERTEFFVHYDGAHPIGITGVEVPRRIQRIHLGNGWSGIGYNWVVDQDGTVFEGRGWGRVGAHCPEHNRSGWGVQVAIGGDQQPTPQALAAVRWLYDEACARSGRTLAKLGHRDRYPTECPGEHLHAWVRAGMPAPAAQAASAATSTGGSGMDLYRDSKGRIWDVGPAGRRYIAHPGVVAAYQSTGRRVAAIGDDALVTIPRLPDDGLAGLARIVGEVSAAVEGLRAALTPPAPPG